ncbi:MAG: hypothetical protein K0V04_01575 [Deltaproteobacteria bacterium]|nr:hypothetical protein [Deltaproteobacteria bacterium]
MSALEQLVGNMTVAQLAQAAGKDVASIVALVLASGKGASTATRAPVTRQAKKVTKRAESTVEAVAAPAAAPSSGDGHNTRTRAGRQVLDAAILEFLKGQTEPVRALDIRRGVGGTAAQVRTRLNVLIDKKKVTYKGRASGTRYRAR